MKFLSPRSLKYLAFCTLVLLAWLGAGSPDASAQTASSTTVDVTSVTTTIANIAFAALASAGAWVAGMIIRKLGLEAHSAAYDAVNGLLENAVHFGVIKSQALLASTDLTKVDVHSSIAAHAITYAQQFGAPLLAQFGLSGTDLEHMAMARIAKLYPDIASPDATAFTAAALSSTAVPAA